MTTGVDNYVRIPVNKEETSSTSVTNSELDRSAPMVRGMSRKSSLYFTRWQFAYKLLEMVINEMCVL